MTARTSHFEVPRFKPRHQAKSTESAKNINWLVAARQAAESIKAAERFGFPRLARLLSFPHEPILRRPPARGRAPRRPRNRLRRRRPPTSQLRRPQHHGRNFAHGSDVRRNRSAWALRPQRRLERRRHHWHGHEGKEFPHGRPGRL